jgi:hypothetical protein
MYKTIKIETIQKLLRIPEKPTWRNTVIKKVHIEDKSYFGLGFSDCHKALKNVRQKGMTVRN